jgi:hypothetical protein
MFIPILRKLVRTEPKLGKDRLFSSSRTPFHACGQSAAMFRRYDFDPVDRCENSFVT